VRMVEEAAYVYVGLGNLSHMVKSHFYGSAFVPFLINSLS
jgi:hypothetical protein